MSFSLKKAQFCPMKYDEKTVQAAKDLFVRGQKNQKEIASILSIPPSTLTQWVKKGAWEQERAALAISVDNIIPKILSKINSDIDEGKLSADALAKYCKQLRELSKNSLTINDYHQVMVKFCDYLRLQATRDKCITSEVLQVVVTVQDAFLKSVVNNE